MSENALDDVLIDNPSQALNVEYAGFWVRLLASIIDSLVMIPIILLSFYNILYFKSMLFMVLLTVIASIYKPLFEWRFGATFGKMAVKIKVVNLNYGNLALSQAFGRYIPWAITQVLSLLTYFYLFNSANFQDLTSLAAMGEFNQESPIDTTSTIYNFIFLVIVGRLIFDPKKQGWHDKIAQTYCIKLKKSH